MLRDDADVEWLQPLYTNGENRKLHKHFGGKFLIKLSINLLHDSRNAIPKYLPREIKTC